MMPHRACVSGIWLHGQMLVVEALSLIEKVRTLESEESQMVCLLAMHFVGSMSETC